MLDDKEFGFGEIKEKYSDGKRSNNCSKVLDDYRMRVFDIEFFNYRLELTSYAILAFISTAFTLFSIYTCIIELRFLSLGNIFVLLIPVVIFGYISFFAIFIFMRRKRKFSRTLFKDFLNEYNSIENKGESFEVDSIKK